MGAESAGNQVAIARFEADRVRIEIEQAEAKKNSLVKYTIPIGLKQRQAAVELARSKAMMLKAEWSLANDVVARLEREADRIDADAPTRAEHAALDKFTALEKPWKAILARRADIAKADPAARDELGKLLGDFGRSLDEAERAWSSAREARLDDRATATMTRVRRGPP
jgi:hypothetical protein